MRLKNVHILSIAVLCTVLLALTAFVIYREYNPPWKAYQERFNRLRYSKNPESRYRTAGIRQIWIRGLDIVDRCMTCHLAEDRDGFDNQPHPLRSHSGSYLKTHPVKRFGCVLCHDGQGEALTVEDAHGTVIYSGRPILKGRLAEASCIRCHPMPQALPLEAKLKGAPTLSMGWRLFNEYNCVACHKLRGYRRPEHIAPSLSKIGSKVTEEWLSRWLKDPKDYLPGTKMPRYRFNDQDIADIASYLLDLRDRAFEGPIGFDPYDKGLRRRGRLLFESLGCLGCHRIGKKGVLFGPDLTDIGNKVRPAWLYHFLKNPRAYDPKTIIPDLRLKEGDIPPITAYLMSLKRHQERETVSLTGDKERGRRLIRDYGCLGCHEIGRMRFQYIAPSLDGIGDKRVQELAFGDLKGIERSLINWLRIKVREPGRFTTRRMLMRMPEFNLNEEQAEALVTFLLGIRKKPIDTGYIKDIIHPDDISMKGKRVIDRYNCLGCHKIRNKGGEIGPELTNEGKKSRPEWLYVFLKRPWKIRPILRARMPDFRLSDRDTNTIIEYLSYISGEAYPYLFEEKRKVYPEDIMDGEKLYHEIFACIACHRINGRGGVIGPDHTDISSRLRRQWIEKWIKDPLSIKRDVRMPVFKFEDWQFEAIVDYLMTLGRYRFLEERSGM